MVEKSEELSMRYYFSSEGTRIYGVFRIIWGFVGGGVSHNSRLVSFHQDFCPVTVNTCGGDAVVVLINSNRSGSRGRGQPDSLLAVLKAYSTCSGISPLLTSCLRIAPSMFGVVCSCWARKSRYGSTTAISLPG